jgi:hypothetical protein
MQQSFFKPVYKLSANFFERVCRQVREVGVPGGADEGRRQGLAQGTDLTNLHFGRKIFGQIFIGKFWTTFQSNTDINF